MKKFKAVLFKVEENEKVFLEFDAVNIEDALEQAYEEADELEDALSEAEDSKQEVAVIAVYSLDALENLEN